MDDLACLLPLWEVFHPRSGVTIGYRRARHFELAIAEIAVESGLPNVILDALLVSVETLDHVRTGPAYSGPLE
jgi:hypothetical protein